MSSGSFKNVIYKMYLEIIYLIYMYQKDLALNDVQWMICHKTKPNQITVRETDIQSQVESYQRLKKWYLIPPCLTLSIMRCISRVKRNNPRGRAAPSHTTRCSSD